MAGLGLFRLDWEPVGREKNTRDRCDRPSGILHLLTETYLPVSIIDLGVTIAAFLALFVRGRSGTPTKKVIKSKRGALFHPYRSEQELLK